MIRLTRGLARPVEPIERLLRVPETGDRIETYEGPMVADIVVCEVVPAPGIEGVWRVTLVPAGDFP